MDYSRFSKHGEIMLAAGVVVILFVMLVPLPTFFLDIMLCVSISISLLVLVTTMFMTSPLEFTIFPSLLLVTTLLRLALNVASTRLILLNGDMGAEAAGSVIRSFGEFVVGGSYVVGGVIFMIMFILNKSVITAGTTRIAEVAARFTLDAMPGKQMAIEADLNAGLIDEEEANERRHALRKEADFYGAMDGACKFVSGDVNAGMMITMVNLIGGIIMTHGDNNGLCLPPAVAPVQVVIVPIAQHKEGVVEKATALYEQLKKFARVKLDVSEQSAGWKFAEYEMKGVPLRLEIGPRDIENNCCVIARRDNGEKVTVSLDTLETEIPALLQKVHDNMYAKALANLENRTYACTSLDEIRKTLADKGDSFIKAMWCGDEACEDAIKAETGVGSRCIPFAQEHLADTCVCCGKPAKHMVLWAKAY